MSYETPSYMLRNEGKGSFIFDGHCVPYTLFRVWRNDSWPKAGDIFLVDLEDDEMWTCLSVDDIFLVDLEDDEMWTCLSVEEDDMNSAQEVTVRAARTKDFATVEHKLSGGPKLKGMLLC
jgi:hypothetical protein